MQFYLLSITIIDNLSLYETHGKLKLYRFPSFIVECYYVDKVYCSIPYSYMTNPQLCFDALALRQLTNDNFGNENWHGIDSVNYIKTGLLLFGLVKKTKIL